MRLALLLWMVPVVVAQEPRGSIQGTVTDSVSHTPVRQARITVRAQSSTPFVRKETQTDANGAFSVTGLAPGRYGVEFSHPSYPNPGRRRPTRSVRVEPGSEPVKVTLELVPGASISGRVLDPDGDPIPRCLVHLISRASGQRNFGANGRSNVEDGTYRVSDIAPGKYLAVAVCGVAPFQPRPLLPSTTTSPPPAVGYAPQYYPGTREEGTAEVLELGPGFHKSGVDFRMRLTKVYTVSGSVRYPPGERPPDGAFVSIIPRFRLRTSFDGRGGPVHRDKGTFEITGVIPGSYILSARVEAPRTSRTPAEGFLGKMPIEVVDRTLEVVLDVQPSFELNASIKLEREDSKFDPEQCSLRINATDGLWESEAQMDAEGKIKIPGMRPGQYRLAIFGPNVYIKSITVGGHDTPGGMLELSSAPGEIRIMLSTNTGTIKGTAPAGSMIMANPADDEMSYGRGAGVDDRGQFSIPGLPPGKYRVGLQGEEGQEVTIGEGQTVDVVVKAGQDR